MASAYPRRRLLGGARFQYDPAASQRQIFTPDNSMAQEQHRRFLAEEEARKARQAQNAYTGGAIKDTADAFKPSGGKPVADDVQDAAQGPQRPLIASESPEGGGITGQLPFIPGSDGAVGDPLRMPMPSGDRGLDDSARGGMPYPSSSQGEQNIPSNIPYSQYEPGAAESPVAGASGQGRLLSGDSGITGQTPYGGAPSFPPPSTDLVNTNIQPQTGNPGDAYTGGVNGSGQSTLIDPSMPNGTGGAKPAVEAGKKRLLSGNIRSSEDINRDIAGTYAPLPPKGPNGENREKSFGKRLLGGIWNGLQEWADSGGQGDLMGALESAAIGGGVSAASPRAYAKSQQYMNRRDLYGELDRSQQQEGYNAQKATVEAKNAKTYSDIYNQQIEQAYKANKEEWDALKFVYSQSDEFDPTDPQNAETVARMKQAGFPVFRKKAGESYDIAPNGQMYNKKTGKVIEGSDFSKGPTITNNELPDSLFGIDDDSTVVNKAKAAVGKGPEGTQLRPDATTRAASYFNNGQFDENKYWADRSMGLTDVSPSDIYQNIPSDYEQRLASKVAALKGQQKGMREEAAKFRLAVTNQRPPANPEYTATPLQMVELFKQVMAMPDAKKRAAKLAELYGTISKTRLN